MMFSRSARKKGRPAKSARPLSESQEPEVRERRTRHVALTAAFVVLVAALSPPLAPISFTNAYMDFEAIPPDDIQAEFAFDSIDLDATGKARDEAAAKVPDTYRVEQEMLEAQMALFGALSESIRKNREGMKEALERALTVSDSSQDLDEIVWQAALNQARLLIASKRILWRGDPAAVAVFLAPDTRSIPVREFEKAPEGAPQPTPAPPRKVAALRSAEMTNLTYTAADRLLDVSEEALRYALSHGVLAPDAESKPAAQSIKILRAAPAGDQPISEVLPAAEFPLPHLAAAMLQARIIEELQLLPSQFDTVPVSRDKVQYGTVELAKPFIANTLAFDSISTASEKEEARRTQEDKTKRIPVKKIIQPGGYPWTEQSIVDYRAYLEAKRAQRPLERYVAGMAANIILVALFLVFLVRMSELLRGRRAAPYKHLNVALLILCTTVALGRVMYYFEPSGFLVPGAAGAILLAILVNARLAALTGALAAGLLSAQYDYNWPLLIVQATMSLAGVLSISVVRRRSDMTAAAVKATFIGVIAALGVTLAGDTLLGEIALRRSALIGLNGLACLFLVPGLLPPIERLFGITTDIQLLEYSDLNNELLSRLAIEVPATYAHSLMLGQLAEAAADAVGANGLLAQVCAYYHDIGKLRRPEYFVENQTGSNIHDVLSPRLSARAIASHVIEGAEMARECHLPKPIVDGIFEHHGTLLISFFYQEALAQQKHDDVREEDFRYPGPKPQTRETAILMICDAVESGVRTIKNPNEERIREMVEKIIHARSEDGQFDECDLTLKDLDTIKEVITKRLLGTMHRRIAYPDAAREQKAPNVIRLSGGQES